MTTLELAAYLIDDAKRNGDKKIVASSVSTTAIRLAFINDDGSQRLFFRAIAVEKETRKTKIGIVGIRDGVFDDYTGPDKDGKYPCEKGEDSPCGCQTCFGKISPHRLDLLTDPDVIVVTNSDGSKSLGHRN